MAHFLQKLQASFFTIKLHRLVDFLSFLELEKAVPLSIDEIPVRVRVKTCVMDPVSHTWVISVD